MKSLLIIFAILLLSGCGHIRTGEPEFARSLMMANVNAIVVNDEVYSSFALTNFDRVAGVETAEKQYRRVVVKSINSDGGKPMAGFAGSRLFEVVVPDGTPWMKAGDLVEVRSTTFYDSLKGFSTSKDGSALLRLICPGAPMKETKECTKDLPWYKPWGEEKRYFYGILASPSGRPFLAQLKDYSGVAYSPFYDSEGTQLPGAVVPQPRPVLQIVP